LPELHETTTMTKLQWDRVKELFAEACELPTQLQGGFLEEACGDDADLRGEVEQLLEHHVAAEVTSGVATPDGGHALSEGPGSVIGRYKLLEELGQGGMGVVYMAEQTEPVRRQVALKIIKLGMDTKEVVGRFEAERQALAMMDHPNIASVLDAGSTETGRPFFVMELVRGIPITDYCDDRKLSTPERLELFRQVCLAIQHAHTKGVIHRDIKPTNVMITLHDGVAVPKVIDFGIAKATDQSLTEKTYFTQYSQIIGTPEYMAPEQAEMSGLDIDTRADIYSLGVLLYELVTGTKPFDLKTLLASGYQEMLRTIREVDPPKPSTRVSALGQRITNIAEMRSSDPQRFSRGVSGDLDWIIMRALEKDRTRRYETATDFARDVARHLADEPVEAGPPSARYRLGKAARRNRGALAAGAFALVAMIGGVAIGAVAFNQALLDRESALERALEAERGQRLALEQGEDADRMNVFLRKNLSPTAWIDGDSQDSLVEMLDRAAGEIDNYFEDSPRLRAQMHGVVGEGFLSHGRTEKAREHLPQAQQIMVRIEGAAHPESLALGNDMVSLYLAEGDTAGALVQQEHLVEISRRVLGLADPVTLEAEGNLAMIHLKAGNTGHAAQALANLGMTFGISAKSPSLLNLDHNTQSFVVVEDGGSRFSWVGAYEAPEFPGAAETMIVSKLLALSRSERAQAADKNRAAWCLLTTPSPRLRNVPQALELAREACEQTGNSDPLCMDTLSLALFRTGDSHGAASNQRQALQLLTPQQTLLRSDMERALGVFEGRLEVGEGLGDALFPRWEGEPTEHALIFDSSANAFVVDNVDVEVSYSSTTGRRAVVRVGTAVAPMAPVVSLAADG
jgi:tetratricopeptide (TPR) repeat protein